MERPMWADEPVRVIRPDPSLVLEADLLRREVETLLHDRLVAPVEHVGSTAIPGIPSKPTIDLLAPVADLDVADELGGRLAAAGWELVPPDLDGRPWRRFLVLPDGPHRRAHLYLVAADHPRAKDLVRFRDHLRRDRRTANAYGALKHRLARQHVTDREAYTRAKMSFIDEVLHGLGHR
jgi:GrpB-like predicted nucleotidyltransferase (UPF0157 family)